MRPVVLTLGAAGVTPWVPVNYIQNGFLLGMSGEMTSGGGLTWAIQYTMDDLGQEFRPVSISRSTTTATVTDPDHRLSVGDSIIVAGTGSSNLDGTYAVASIVDANSYTYTVANTGAAAGGVNSKLKSLRVLTHATLTDQTASAAGSLAYPVRAVRGAVTAYTSGKIDFTFLQGADS
jgi:hypothetical protein